VAPDSDEQLMLQYAGGHIAAFEQLYHRHRGPLFRYLLRQLRNPSVCEDLFQEVWSRVIQASHRYRPSAKFSTYLYTVAHNCLVDHIRRESRRGTSTDTDLLPAPELDDPARRMEADQAASALAVAITKLPADQRDAFLLRAEGGLSLAQIAQVTGVKPETAKSRLRYAFARLREAIPAEAVSAEEHAV
jgi:RNA polymerase sigma-70 factor (ECF subfamily)